MNEKYENKDSVRGKKMDEEKTYKIVCPYCQKEQYACKSIFQEMGMDAGIGTCLHCQKLMTLVYDQENDTMAAGKWERLEDSSVK